MTAFQGRPGAEAAKELGMKVATVFVARSRVQKLLQEEIQRLEDPGPPRPGAYPPGWRWELACRRPT